MPNFRSSLCAYHPNQLLTNFCNCPQCLLPVCPTCIKLHSQDHTNKNSSPRYEKIDTTFLQVYESCSNIMKGLSRLKSQLLEVEKVKKENQSLILEKIKVYRNKIIREFERALTDLQYEMVKKFQQEGDIFVYQIEDIDHRIDRIYKDIQQQKQNLQNQNGLRTVIFHLSKQIQLQNLKQISSINQKLKSMLKKNICLSVEQSSVDEVRLSVQNYLKLGTMDWELKKQSKSMPTQQNPNHETSINQKLNINISPNNQQYSSRHRLNNLI